MAFGRVVEVFIPNKLDRWGLRFGFVKFRDVSDELELEKRLSDSWLGDQKLKINLARFGKEVTSREHPVAEGGRKERPPAWVEAGKSFKSAMGFKRTSEGGPSRENPVLEIVPSMDIMEELKTCFVGFLAGFIEPRRLQSALFMAGNYGEANGREYGSS